MSTYDKRLDAVEKDIAVMKQDIIEKLFENSSAIMMVTGPLGRQGQDIKFLLNQTKTIDVHLDSVDLRLDSIDLRLDGMDQHFNGVDKRLETLENRLTSLEQSVNNRFDVLEKKFDQVIVALTTLTNKLQ
jgi:peptidoglycan hydrolase CwlO-like protein